MIEPVPHTPSKQHLRLWLRLLRTTRSVENEIRELLRTEFDTTLPRFDVMAALFRHAQGISMTELSRELMVSNGNVTGIIDRLAADGSVTKSAKPGDKRTTKVQLSPTGRKTFQEMATAHEGWINTLLGELDDSETDQTIALFDRLEHASTETASKVSGEQTS